jgi:hypothetical protein
VTSELNPNHPTSQAVHNLWHQITALIMHKLEIDHIVISSADVDALDQRHVSITVQELDDGLHLALMDASEAAALARREGGLPS